MKTPKFNCLFFYNIWIITTKKETIRLSCLGYKWQKPQKHHKCTKPQWVNPTCVFPKQIYRDGGPRLQRWGRRNLWQMQEFTHWTLGIVTLVLTHWPLGNLNEIFRHLIFKQILVIDGWGISCEICLQWLSLDFTDDQSTLVQVMAWCHQATSHYLSQCWPRSLSPYGVTRPQWVNSLCLNDAIWWLRTGSPLA